MKRLRKLFEKWIRKQYQKIRCKEGFLITSKEVNVKKGKRRYTILIFETNQQKVRINLGRHKTPDEIDLIILTI